MQQVIAIHGGTTFADYNDYLTFLASKPLIANRFTHQPMWKDLLQDNLGDEYQVLLPKMPNATNAKYSEWAIWFRHFTELIEDDCILIGHSLGAVFLAKYLSENEFARRIKATILVAAPFEDESDEDLTDFKLTEVSELFIKQAGQVTLYFGYDDPVIVPTEIKKYSQYLPDAKFNVVSAPDHFVRADFPEMITTIKELTIL